jgi:multicomponent Na+:H+ antiporter subunit D
MVIFSVAPLFAVLVSALSALLIACTGERHANLREFWSVGGGIAMFAVIAAMVPDVLAGRTPQCVLFRILNGIELAFRVDALGLLFAAGASLLWILTSFYSIGYMRSLKEHAQTRYFSCFALSLSATMGVAFSANLFTLFLFYETLTLVTYPLVGHKETAEAKRTHAAAQLAASCHGGPHSGERIAACGSGGQDWGLLHTSGFSLRLRF